VEVEVEVVEVNKEVDDMECAKGRVLTDQKEEGQLVLVGVGAALVGAAVEVAEVQVEAVVEALVEQGEVVVEEVVEEVFLPQLPNL